MSWLWKGDTSPASYEKVLSKLSVQITNASNALEKTRSRGRRAKALWTLYTTLLYLVYTLILVLVIGPQEWSIPHYAGLLATPFVVFAVRKGLTAAFEWTASRQQVYLDSLQKQRESKIADLKKATKYDTTQELLQKYGGTPPKQTPSKQSQQANKKKNPPSIPQQRTGLPPPPTANIPGRNIQPSPSFRLPQTPESAMSQRLPMQRTSPQSPAIYEQFAPNAYSQPPPKYESEKTHHWYDRILDVMLGEDETSAQNRLVLLCQNCRLVNGQAPPGVKTLEELGKWKCSSCHSWNNEAKSAIAQIVSEAKSDSQHEDQLHHDLNASTIGHHEAVRSEPHDLEHEETEAGESDEEQSTEMIHISDKSKSDDGNGITKRVTRSAGKNVE